MSPHSNDPFPFAHKMKKKTPYYSSYISITGDRPYHQCDPMWLSFFSISKKN